MLLHNNITNLDKVNMTFTFDKDYIQYDLLSTIKKNNNVEADNLHQVLGKLKFQPTNKKKKDRWTKPVHISDDISISLQLFENFKGYWNITGVCSFKMVNLVKNELVLHREEYDDKFERPTVKDKNNFFDVNGFKGKKIPDLMDRYYLPRLNYQIEVAERLIQKHIIQLIGDSEEVQKLNKSFSHIEINFDFAVEHAYQVYKLLLPVFVSRVHNVKYDYHSEDMAVKITEEKNNMIVTGQITKHKFMKMYTKAMNIIRLELTYNRSIECNKALRHTDPDSLDGRMIMDWGEANYNEMTDDEIDEAAHNTTYDIYGTFQKIINDFEGIFLPLIEEMNETVVPMPISSLSKAMSMLTPQMMKHPKLDELITCLIHKGKVHVSDKGETDKNLYKLVLRMKALGLLDSIGGKSGYYRPVGDFGRFIRCMGKGKILRGQPLKCEILLHQIAFLRLRLLRCPDCAHCAFGGSFIMNSRRLLTPLTKLFDFAL